MNNKYTFSIIILFFSIFVSCSPYKLCNREEQEDIRHHFVCYSDSIVFNYHTNIIYRADNDYFYPIPFTVTLPSGIVNYFYMNSKDFVFYYGADQIIYIRVDLSINAKRNQTKYYPLKAEVDSIVSKLSYEAGKIHDLQFDFSNRKHIIIQKDNFTILLCNIKEKNIDRFTELIFKSKFIQ